MRKRLACVALALAVTLAGLYLTFRTVLIHKANSRVETILAGADLQNPVATSLQATQNLYSTFQKHDYRDHKILARLRPYIANARLPAFIRVPAGTIELVTNEGWCDDGARALIYTLDKAHITARQWNIQGLTTAHAAVVVNLNGTTALLDPFYGYHSIPNGAPISPEKAAGKNALVAIDKNANRKFYKDFGTYFMSAQGDPLVITATLPKQKTTLGKIDAQSADVRSAGVAHDMTKMWDYIGHRYDRSWVRELRAPMQMKVDIILTEPANESALRTLSPTPAVDGTKLTWNLLKDQKIKSEDGKAGISLKRLNSYIDIDQIIITPEGDTP
jgi:hypothetical protein